MAGRNGKTLPPHNVSIDSAALSQLLKLLGGKALKDARIDAPDTSPKVTIEVTWTGRGLVVGRGRALLCENAEKVEGEALRGLPLLHAYRDTFEVHESELPAFEALLEPATVAEIESAKRELEHHEDLIKNNRRNELNGRFYRPSFATSFRRMNHRDLKPILSIQRA